jgi:nucleoid DNA-binding protein
MFNKIYNRKEVVNMNQKELILELKARSMLGTPTDEIDEIIRNFKDIVIEEVVNNNKPLKLQGLGTFKPKVLKARELKDHFNNRQDTYFLNERRSISFKPSKKVVKELK